MAATHTSLPQIYMTVGVKTTQANALLVIPVEARTGKSCLAPSCIRILQAILAVVVSFAWSFSIARGMPFLACGAAWAATGGGPSVQALVEKDSVYVGEPFLLQIRVEGSDIAPGTNQPDMSEVADFAVEFLGGQSNNSSSIIIINGKMSKVESYGYVYSIG